MFAQLYAARPALIRTLQPSPLRIRSAERDHARVTIAAQLNIGVGVALAYKRSKTTCASRCWRWIDRWASGMRR